MLSLITHYRLCVLLLLNAVLPSREACHEAEQGKQADGGEGDHPGAAFQSCRITEYSLKVLAIELMWVHH